MIIDAQVHAYEASPPDAHLADAIGILEVNGDQMVAAMDGVGVDGAICVSPWSVYRGDTTFVESVYHAHPDRFRLVAPIDPRVERVAQRVAGWSTTPGAVGIRLLRLPDLVFDPADPGVAVAVNGAAAVGLAVNVQCWDRIWVMDDIANMCPDAQLVLDHLGLTQPLAPPAPMDAFDDLARVLALAQYPNVAVKVTGACTYSRRAFPFDDLWDPVGRLIDTFGVDRCMWGTDWTRTARFLTYDEGVRAFRDHWPLSSSDKASLMGATAMRIYNW